MPIVPGLRCASLFAGLLATTPAQVAWQQLAPPLAPPARAWHAAAPEPGGRVLVFGGFGRNGTTPIWTDDTWLFDGAAWTQALPSVRPAARSGHRLAHDLLRGRVVLFGGNTSGALLNDTWEWDGTSWLAQVPAHAPSHRTHSAMAFDLPRARTVLFSGANGGTSPLITNDTWEWDGVDWQLVSTAQAPSPRFGVGLACDIQRARLVLFGGFDGTMRDDTWEYDGQNWIQLAPATVPPARHYPGFAFDPLRGRTVMVGGGVAIFTGDLGDVWEWNGSNWLPRQPGGPQPSPRRGQTMVRDWAFPWTMMFGGAIDGTGYTVFADTFLYAPVAVPAIATWSGGCGGTAGAPVLAPSGMPWLGDPWGLTLAPLPAGAPAFLVAGWSRTAWGTTPLPLSLAGWGLPGCSLLVSPDAAWFTVAVAQLATWPIAIPANPALLGATMYLQAAGVDPAANAGGLVVSDGLAVTFGGR